MATMVFAADQMHLLDVGDRIVAVDHRPHDPPLIVESRSGGSQSPVPLVNPTGSGTIWRLYPTHVERCVTVERAAPTPEPDPAPVVAPPQRYQPRTPEREAFRRNPRYFGILSELLSDPHADLDRGDSMRCSVLGWYGWVERVKPRGPGRWAITDKGRAAFSREMQRRGWS